MTAVERFVDVEAKNVDGLTGYAGVLLSARAIPADFTRSGTPSSSGPLLAAVQTIGQASPALQQLLSTAAQAGEALTVSFPAPVLEGLRHGTLALVQTADGTLPIARDSAGQMASIARVTGGGAAFGGTVALGATAAAVLPVAVAAAAAYAQQQRLERSLARIEAAIGRVETRLEDADNGVCDAAESFVRLALQTLHQTSDMPSYLQAELAAHRVAVEAVYAGRQRYVRRFKGELEVQQVRRQGQTGERNPWVDAVYDGIRDGKLENELVLYVRALIIRSKLIALVALTLAGEGHAQPALLLMGEAEQELRKEFFDLHNRLKPLARIAPPDRSLRERLPFQGRDLETAQATIKTLVRDLDEHVLPTIPDPDGRELVATFTCEEVVALHRTYSATPEP